MSELNGNELNGGHANSNGTQAVAEPEVDEDSTEQAVPAVHQVDIDTQKALAGVAQLEQPLVPDEMIIDVDRSEPQKVATADKPASRSIWTLTLVGGLLGFLGMIVFLLSGAGGRPKVTVVQPTPTPSTTPAPDELAQTQARLALTDQQRQNRDASGTTRPLTQTSPTPKPSASPTPPTIASSAPQTLPPPPAPLPPPVITSTAPSPAPTPLSPVEQWQLAAQMGSFGATRSNGANAATSTTAPTAPITSATASSPALPIPVAASSNPRQLPITQLRNSPDVPGMRSQPLAAVMLGSTATGQLQTEIILSSGVDQQDVKYLIQVRDPLKDVNGAIALPSGSTIVATIDRSSGQAGAVQFKAISLIYNNQEYALPEGSLVIRNKDGGVLQARRQGGGGGIGQFILPALFNGLSQAGQVAAQPRSTTTTTTGNRTTTSTDGRGNPQSAFIGGAANSISQQLQQQAQMANQQAATQPVSWRLAAETEVQIFVNSTFEM
jgi:hypothetical protein